MVMVLLFRGYCLCDSNLIGSVAWRQGFDFGLMGNQQ